MRQKGGQIYVKCGKSRATKYRTLFEQPIHLKCVKWRSGSPPFSFAGGMYG